MTWIKVEDGLPPAGKKVLIHIADKDRIGSRVGYWNEKACGWVAEVSFRGMKPISWKLLPEKP